MLSKPKKPENGLFKEIDNKVSFIAENDFTLDKTHLPGEATLLSNNLFNEYSKSSAVTFLPFSIDDLSIL